MRAAFVSSPFLPKGLSRFNLNPTIPSPNTMPCLYTCHTQFCKSRGRLQYISQHSFNFIAFRTSNKVVLDHRDNLISDVLNCENAVGKQLHLKDCPKLEKRHLACYIPKSPPARLVSPCELGGWMETNQTHLQSRLRLEGFHNLG
jgi:hypothetical protein